MLVSEAHRVDLELRMPAISSDPLSASPSDADAETGSRAKPADALAGLVDMAVEPSVDGALRAVREMLGMDVAYISQIVGGDMVLRDFDGDGDSFGMAEGLTLPAAQTYCQRMLDGRVPNLIPDVRAEDRLASLPITKLGNIGAFATVPLTFADGRVHATLCAASHDATPLGYRELQFLKVFARLISDQIERENVGLAARELAALVNAADDAILGMTPVGVVTSWNSACERIFGYPADEAIGQSIVDLVAPSGQEEGMRQALRAVSAGEVFHHQSPRRRADGALIDTSVTLSPVRDEHGAVRSISAVIRDVSAEVRQARFRATEREMISALASASDAAEAAVGVLRAVSEGLDCDFAAMWEVDQAAERLRCTSRWINQESIAAPLAQAMCERVFARGEGLPGRVWDRGESVWLERLDDAGEFPRAAAAAAAGLRSAVAMPLRFAGEVVGVVEFFTCAETRRSAELLAMGEAAVARLADSLQRHHAEAAVREAAHALEVRVLERTSELQDTLNELDAAQTETVRRLSRAVEFRDQDTGAHIARMSAFAAGLARRVGLDVERCGLIERASPLHDVGKVAISDSVLLKPGPLTPAERSVMETHAEIGHRLLEGSDSAVLQLAALIALTHHERYDGDGYPNGLAGESIPIEGRIVAIADVFDALTSDRVYRPAMNVDQAVSIMQDGRGTQFDPVRLDQFLTRLSEAGSLPLAAAAGS